MRANPNPFRLDMLERCFLAVLLVGVSSALMFLIGRDMLGDAVIALLYLVPIGYSTTRWGQWPGICAAVTAALTFDFFFIPPYYTFTVGSVEGWLVLIIFLVVAILIVGRIQYGLAQAQQREREAIFMYELSSALAGLRTPGSVARYLAEKLQQVYQAALIQIVMELGESTRVFSVPEGVGKDERPDLVLPLQAPDGLAGEIHLWEGELPLPERDNRFLQSCCLQGALALERTDEYIGLGGAKASPSSGDTDIASKGEELGRSSLENGQLREA